MSNGAITEVMVPQSESETDGPVADVPPADTTRARAADTATTARAAHPTTCARNLLSTDVSRLVAEEAEISTRGQ